MYFFQVPTPGNCNCLAFTAAYCRRLIHTPSPVCIVENLVGKAMSLGPGRNDEWRTQDNAASGVHRARWPVADPGRYHKPREYKDGGARLTTLPD